MAKIFVRFSFIGPYRSGFLSQGKTRLINKDYRYLHEMCVETGLLQALTLNSACVAKIA